jgi:putative membrane protein
MFDRQTRRMGMGMLATGCLAVLAACGGDQAGTDTAGATGAATMPAAGAATGDTMGGTMGGTAAAGAMSDAQILAQASGSNGAEIAAGQIAQGKARNTEVRNYARDMVTEHQAMQGQVDRVVTSAGITPQLAQPDTMQQKLDQARQQLQGQAAGPEFDRMYMDMQVRDHEATLNLLNAARGAAQNAEVRTVVEQAIPKVQQHLERARQIRGTLGGG